MYGAPTMPAMYGQVPPQAYGRGGGGGGGMGGMPPQAYGFPPGAAGLYAQRGFPPMGYGAPMGYGRGMGGPGMGVGFRGGMHPPRRRKQFVGGTLETQREWEQQNLCCFFLQGQCKFAERCRYSHDDDGVKGCQFGLSCRVGHASRGHKSEGAPQQPQQQQQQQITPPQPPQ